MTRLDIGCGSKKTNFFVGIDRHKTPSADILGDINCLPIKSNTIKEVVCNHILEHVDNLTVTMRELHRILKPNGLLFIKAPHTNSLWSRSNPEHKTFFTIWTMNYYSIWDEFNLDFKFNIIQKKLYTKNSFINYILNIRPEYFEKFLPFIDLFNLSGEVRFIMEAIK
jgi:predicted SAM-dependent methyltransferase